MQKPAVLRRNVLNAYYARDPDALQAALDGLEHAIGAQAWSEGCSTGIAWGKAVASHQAGADRAQGDLDPPVNPHIQIRA